MNGNYLRLYTRLLNDPAYAELPHLAGRLTFHVIGRANPLGLFEFSVGKEAEVLNAPLEQVREALDLVLATFDWRYDQGTTSSGSPAGGGGTSPTG